MYRALATANAFAREGWEVTVLTTTRETLERLTGTDPESETAVRPDIRVVRIPYDSERGETDLSHWSRSRVFSPMLWNYLRVRSSSFWFPEAGYGRWKPALVEAAHQVHRERPVDLVVGSANPNVDFAPGEFLHRRFGVPFVLDYRDAWTLDVYSGRRAHGRRSRAGRYERRLFSNAWEAWFVNTPIRDWHAHEYPDRRDDLHVVANGWDAAFLSLAPRLRLGSENGLVYGYLGTIYGPMPLRETLEGWRLARMRSPLVERSRLEFRGRLGHFAEPDRQAGALLDEFAGDGVTYLGPVSKTEVANAYDHTDALVLMVSRSPFVTSGKVFEYAATGLPIAAVHHPETAATSVLRGRPDWFPVSDVTPEEIAEAIIAAGERAVSMTAQDIESARSWAAPLERDQQLMPRVRALTERIGPLR